MNNVTSRLSWLLVLSALGSIGGPAIAQGSQQEAVAKYKQGRALIEKKDYEGALRELTASYALLDSPNTLLLMAHAQRELGREAEAAALYEKVVKDANSRALEGERRFLKTGEDAQGWVDRLSKRLGKITVRVNDAPEGTTVTVDGENVEAQQIGDRTLKIDSVWWKAGTVRIEASPPGGEAKTVTVEVLPGEAATATLDLTVVEEEEDDSDSGSVPVIDSKDLEGRSIPTGTWVMGGLGLAGVATFAVFGSMAKSKASELDECSPRCPESQRDLADQGKRDQTIANIGLVVGGIGLATAAGFYIFQSSDSRESSVDVAVAPNGLLLRGSFH
jgi:hypothetical protein